MSKFKHTKNIVHNKPITNDTTVLYSGEKLSKADKIFASLGTIEELQAYLGIIKAQHYSAVQSSQMFLSARITQIQETLTRIMLSLGTTKKSNAKYESSRFSSISEKSIGDLEIEINKLSIHSEFKKGGDCPIPGSSLLESNLLYARTLARRAERQVVASKNLSIGLCPENEVIEYLNLLGDYLLYLAYSQ